MQQIDVDKPEQPSPAEEKVYRGPDRRGQPTRMISRYLFRGNRRGGRRAGEQNFIYVDQPGGWIVAGFIALVGLSVLDAFYTLDLLTKGATEANPIMRMALEISDEAFVVIKTVITVVGAAFLSLHKNWPLGRVCMMLALFGYTVLLFYHLWAQTAVGT